VAAVIAVVDGVGWWVGLMSLPRVAQMWVLTGGSMAAEAATQWWWWWWKEEC
jgi:hypothetical protein